MESCITGNPHFFRLQYKSCPGWIVNNIQHRFQAWETIKKLTLELNAQNDADIIKHLESQDSIENYVKCLIRADIAAHNQIPVPGINPDFVRYIRRIHRTSGTTATPLIVALNDVDIDAITTVGARCFRNAGVVDGMRVVHCLNYAGWIGGYTDHASLERAGACVLPWGVGNTEQLIQMILTLGIEAISCTPSYMNILKTVLKERFGMQPYQLGIKLGLFGGEAGLQNVSFRRWQ